jgi:hypothetical protein
MLYPASPRVLPARPENRVIRVREKTYRFPEKRDTVSVEVFEVAVQYLYFLANDSFRYFDELRAFTRYLFLRFSPHWL